MGSVLSKSGIALGACACGDYAIAAMAATVIKEGPLIMGFYMALLAPGASVIAGTLVGIQRGSTTKFSIGCAASAVTLGCVSALKYWQFHFQDSDDDFAELGAMSAPEICRFGAANIITGSIAGAAAGAAFGIPVGTVVGSPLGHTKDGCTLGGIVGTILLAKQSFFWTLCWGVQKMT
eukprot:gnl/MRDRNA2_/MRDRNA2_116630_c0_seq1.p1 gnl/MRDRNA2_/MRDRNA2_116630_c0~~gnl/MRDRNA2_/MRDRNA2_116630_c0_seq1.p1  ORF type:complete len:178 (-),score=32.40 gnl/MRDRNA2_/MRDRNA2_116630_c0_seq1:230-763(-)